MQFASKPPSLFILSLEQTNGKFSEFLLCLLPFANVGVYFEPPLRRSFWVSPDTPTTCDCNASPITFCLEELPFPVPVAGEQGGNLR